MLLSLLVSCEETPYNPKEFLPPAKGDMGEVVVVIDKNYWQGPVMVKLKEIFEKEVISDMQLLEARFTKNQNQLISEKIKIKIKKNYSMIILRKICL